MRRVKKISSRTRTDCLNRLISTFLSTDSVKGTSQTVVDRITDQHRSIHQLTERLTSILNPSQRNVGSRFRGIFTGLDENDDENDDDDDGDDDETGDWIERRFEGFYQRLWFDNRIGLIDRLKFLRQEIRDIYETEYETEKVSNRENFRDVEKVLKFLLELRFSIPLDQIDRNFEEFPIDRQKIYQSSRITKLESDRLLYRQICEVDRLVGDHWNVENSFDSSNSSDSDLESNHSISNLNSLIVKNFSVIEQPSDSKGRRIKRLPPPPPNHQIQSEHSSNLPPRLKNSSRVVVDDELSNQVLLLPIDGLKDFEIYWSDRSSESQTISSIPESIAIRELIFYLSSDSNLPINHDLIYSIEKINPTNSLHSHPIVLSSTFPTLFNRSKLSSASILSSFLPLLNNLNRIRSLVSLRHPKTSSTLTITSEDFQIYSAGLGGGGGGGGSRRRRRRRRLRMVEESFLNSISIVLRKFDHFLTQIETDQISNRSSRQQDDDPEPVWSLIGLFQLISSSGWFDLFDSLNSLIIRSSTAMTKTTLQYSYEGEEGPSPELDDKKLLDNSFQLISRLEKLSRSNLPNLAKHHQLRLSLEMVKIIFLKTFEPSWAFIRDWILYGALPDPHQNFFIEPDPNFKDQLNLDDWWAKSYRIKDSFERVAPEDTLEGQEQPIRSRSSVVPRFLEFMKHEILEAGRSRILLDRLNLKLDTDDAGFGDDGNKLWIRFEDLVLKKEVCELSRRENRIRSNNHCHRSSLLFSSARFRNGWPSRSSEEQEKDTSNVDEEDNKEYFEFELKKIVEDYLRPKLELIYRTLDSKVIQGSSSSHTLADHLGKVGSSSSRRREMVGLKEYIIEFNNFYLSEGGGLMESDLIESIFQKRFSDLNGTGSGFDRTDTDELNLMMIKSFETQRPSKLIMDCMPRLMLVKDESDGFSKEKKSERGGNHLREDEEMMLMIDFRNVSIPVNYVINPRSILKRGYDQIFHRIYLSYRFLKIRFDRLMIDRLKSTKSNYEKTRKGLGCQTSLKGAVKEGKSLGVDLMGLMVVRINWFLNLIKEYYFDLIIKNWKNHITKFFSASYDNLNHDGGLCPRPEGRRRFGERKFIEIIRFVEKSFRELELFLFLNEHKRSGFCVRAKVEKLFKTIEEVLRILAHKDQEPPQEKRERFGSGQLRMRREALGVKVGLEGLRVRFERLIKELESEIYRTEKGLNCKNINMRQIEKEDERTDEMDCIDGGGSDTAESCFVGVGVECLKILKFRLVDEFI